VLLISSCAKLPLNFSLLGNTTTLSGSTVDTSIPTLALTTGQKPPQNPNPGQNVLTVTVNGSSCGSASDQYANEPCTSVTIWAPGTSNCQTINNILVDTGSFGLRIFSSVITVPLQPIANGSGNEAECVQYGDGDSQWGQVQLADIQLAGEPTVTVPIQTINYGYATPPSPCTKPQSVPETSPSSSGFNGILGVGLLAQDCGSTCATDIDNGMYYTCTGSTCTQTAASMENQVQNPVSLLPIDNNGVVFNLPALDQGGATSVTGTLTLGIETQPNNTPSGVTTYTANIEGEFNTTFGSVTTPSFIDSGSSVLFTPPASNLPSCGSAQGGNHGSNWDSLFCPATYQSLVATNNGSDGSTSASVPFMVGNAYNLFTSGNMVFADLASLSASDNTAYFDWGLPFFYGRTVYVGIDGFTSTIGTGTYWAY
jgi:hypothetical protein